MKLKVYLDKRDRFRFRIKAGNGEVLARSTQSYSDFDDILGVIAFIGSSNHDAEIYQDRNGEYRWRLTRHDRGVVISSEGYKSASYCKKISDQVLDAEFVDDGQP
jgi:uncharacterized protein YegP (UPF0339 family)